MVQIIEHGGFLWKPLPDAAATAEEFQQARTLMIKIRKESRWNPWIMDDRAEEYAEATATFYQWVRAEPGHRYLTEGELDARWARSDAKLKQRSAAREAQRLARIADFDARREEARLTLLECEARWRDRERGGRPAGSRDESAALEVEIERLRAEVKDPEAVVDKMGRLPAERRETSLIFFTIRREAEVRRLRVLVGELAAALPSAQPKSAEKTKIRNELATSKEELEKLLAIPPLAAQDMCSECVRPANQHGFVWQGGLHETVPCPAWPRWAARVKEARDMLFRATDSHGKPLVWPVPPGPPKPKPLAIIPSGLPIAEVMAKLADLQARYPDALVRRGTANSWELWPPKPDK